MSYGEKPTFSVTMRNIVKLYGGAYALKNGFIHLRCGQIHALVGENGAGKSTLMKVLAGAIPKNGGEIYINGEKTEINSPFESKKLGISIVYQEFALAPDLTVAENIYMDQIAQTRSLINWKQLKQDTQELLGRLGFEEIKATEYVYKLPVAHQQVVEICKSLQSADTKVLVLDEPTAVLTFGEIEKLFGLLRKLKQEGVCIVYISHRMEEIYEICDWVSVMKDGEFIAEHKVSEIEKEKLISEMVGRELSAMFPKRKHRTLGETILNVENLSSGREVRNVSFSLRQGEILGFSGLVGAGRTETMQAIFGDRKKEGGKVCFMGNEVEFRNPKEAVRAGLGMLSEDRKAFGILLDQPIRINTTIARLNNVCRGGSVGFLKLKEEKRDVEQLLLNLSVKYGSIEDDVSSLSGGNQQKISIAKWLYSKCQCVILDEPTRGVDVGAKLEIYKIINELVDANVGVIVISSEMLEIIGICDRVIVMRSGVVTGEITELEQLTEDTLIRLAMGIA